MSYVKITELPALSDNLLPLTAGDLLPLVHGPVTYAVKLSTIQDYLNLNVAFSAAGDNEQVQVNDQDRLSAFAGFVYKSTLSGVQIGDDNLLTGPRSGILGGAHNTNPRTNTFIIGSDIQAAVDDYTLVNNLSAKTGIRAANDGSSSDWGQSYSYVATQSARLEQSALDTRYVNASGDTMTGSLVTLQDLYAGGNVTGGNVYANTSLGVGTSTPNEAATIVGNLSVTGTIFSNLSGIAQNISNTVYVSISGDDNAEGTSPFKPFRTIKRACAYVAKNQSGVFSNPSNPGAPGLSANKQYTIWVFAGNYEENNPIYLPPSTSLMSDNLRRASIFPINESYDIIWCNNACYSWGFTYRGHVSPAAACAFPLLSSAGQVQNVPWTTRNDAMTAIAYRYGTSVGSPSLYDISSPTTKPFIVTSPYIQGSSSITGDPDNNMPGGCGIRVDGSLVSGFLRSFVMDSFTQTNQGGIGIHIEKDGYAQLVSTFTICCSAGVQVETGGQCDINTSNCSFGDYGLVGIGKSASPVLTAELVRDVQFNSTRVAVSGAFSTFDPVTYQTHNSWTIPVSSPYSGLVFSIEDDPTGANTLYSVSSAYLVDPSTGNFIMTLRSLTDQSIPVFNPNTSAPRVVNFYIKSQILASAYTFEYIGSGTVLSRALPAMGGVGDPDREVLALSGASVYFTSTNNLGDFKVGQGFTILQDSGTIEGRTFSRSILSLVTPLTLALE